MKTLAVDVTQNIYLILFVGNLAIAIITISRPIHIMFVVSAMFWFCVLVMS